MFSRAYRKDSISGFILTVGLVDAVIGSVGEHWSLLGFSLVIIGAAFAVRWWRSHPVRIEPKIHPQYSLADQTSHKAIRLDLPQPKRK